MAVVAPSRMGEAQALDRTDTQHQVLSRLLALGGALVLVGMWQLAAHQPTELWSFVVLGSILLVLGATLLVQRFSHVMAKLLVVFAWMAGSIVCASALRLPQAHFLLVLGAMAAGALFRPAAAAAFATIGAVALWLAAAWHAGADSIVIGYAAGCAGCALLGLYWLTRLWPALPADTASHHAP